MAQRTSDTGHSATFAMATTGAVGNIRSLSGVDFELAKVEDTHLGTTVFKEYIPGDVSEPGELTMEIEFNSLVSLPSRGVVETGTITLPLRASENAAATLAGTGFITRAGFPALETDTLQVATIVFAFDGKTGPTFTVGTTTAP